MAQPRRSPPDDAGAENPHPPRRPRHTLQGGPGRDDFLSDFENDVLTCWDARKGIPKGPHRFKNPEWAALIKRHVFPHHSDVDWFEYVEWVQDGGGDEWFQEEALFCNKHQEGPLDVWYDCDACVQEVRAGPMPRDGRYVWSRCPINGGHSGQTPGDLRRQWPTRGPGVSIRCEESGPTD